VPFPSSQKKILKNDLEDENYPDCLNYLHVTIHGGYRIFKIQGDDITLLETHVNKRTVVGYDRNGEKIPNPVMGWNF
jgi:hypothetical protein